MSEPTKTNRAPAKKAAARTSGGRVPPHSLQAEESLLGAALLSPDALEVLCTELDPSDFYRPIHASIAEACNRLWRTGSTKVDGVIVIDEMLPEDREKIGGLAGLLSMQVNTPASSNARKYAQIVRDMSMLRDLLVVIGDITAMAYESQDAIMVLDHARMLMGSLELPVGDTTPTPNIDEFMAKPMVYDWVVPGLLERGDRTMITAGEGEGKSTLLRQMAVSIAAGMHPFDYYPFEMSNGELPSVFVMDCENSENQTRRKLQPTLKIEGVRRRLDPNRLRIECRPEGIDVTKRHDSRWLQERVAANKPDVVIIGPVYKLYDGDPNKEEFVRQVIHVLDVIRIRYGCALIIEAHSPHAEPGQRVRDLRPLGSSMWKRWPEFGYGLARDHTAADDPSQPVWFRPWRGSRDERQWPGRLHRSSPWPWGLPRDVGAPVHRGDDGYRREEDYYDEEAANDF
jgi:hypothetical protein